MSSKDDPSHQKIFFRQFIEDFYHIGAILPSSRFLARAGAAYLAQKQGPVRVLEAGAGTGAFTRQIVPLLESGDLFDVVEINPSLMRYLQQRFDHDPEFQLEPDIRLNLIEDDVRKIDSGPGYDYIISALPLTNFPSIVVEEILSMMMKSLKPGGIFSYVKYIFIGRLKYLFGSSEVKEEMRKNQAIIKRFADQYQIRRQAVLLNVPPTWVYYWQKPE